MRVDDLKRVHQARPFRPFSIRVADGREYSVAHPEFLAVSATGRALVVSTPDDAFEIIDTVMVASIHVGNGAHQPHRDSGS